MTRIDAETHQRVSGVLAPLPNLPPKSTTPAKEHGFTLLEIMIVVLILTLTAAIALPNLSSTDPYKLDNAARELAEAIRFARAEAIRTATPIGIWYFSSIQKFTVYRVVYVFSVPVPTYDIRHPVDKKLYTLDFSSTGNQAPVQLNSVTLKYGGNGTNRDYITFDNHGTPRYLSGTTYQMLDNASIVLGYAGQTRTLSISPMTGRVTIQ